MDLPTLKESGVRFDEAEHRYWLGDKELLGITSTLVHRAYPNEYDGVSEEKLKERAAYGHQVHEMIEFCLANALEGEMPEWKMFEAMLLEHGLVVISCEYIVTDYERYASPIDLVMMDRNMGVWLVDLKTNYNPPIEKGTCQLSWYKRRFEEMNPKHHVVGCAIAWIRNDEKRGQLSKWIPVTPWSDEALDLLIECDKEDKPFDMQQTYGNLPQKFAEVESEVARIEVQVKELQDKQKTLKDGLYTLMEEANIKSWTGSKVKLTRVLPTSSMTFDAKKFEKDHPDLYQEYLKESKRAGSLKITIVKEK